MLLLHVLFYGPLWCLLSYWIGSCAELASRTESIVKKVFDLAVGKDIWSEVRKDMHDLHNDAKQLSAFWFAYGLGCLGANVFYISLRYSEGGHNICRTSVDL